MVTKIIKKISIEMSGATRRYVVTAKQGDMASRYVEVTLLDGGEEYTISNDLLVRAYIRKPDRKAVYNSCTFSGAKVMVELDSQVLAAAGTASCEIKIQTADLSQRVTSVTFEIEIEPQVMDENAVKSSDQMGVLDEQMKKYADAEAAREKAEDARKTAEENRKKAEESRATEEENRVTAEESRATAEGSRKKAEEARVEAEKKRATAETTRGQQEDAREEAEKKRAAAETTRGQQEDARKKAEERRATAESARETAEGKRVTAEETRQKMAQEVLDKANEAILIASQINQASYIEDRDADVKYAYSIYATNGVPHMALTQIEE